MAGDKKPARVREPVQVYLTSGDRKLLRDVAASAGISGAEVLRRGLRRMAGEILSEQNPAMQLLDEMNSAEWPKDMPTDIAVKHDRYLADEYLGGRKKRGRK